MTDGSDTTPSGPQGGRGADGADYLAWPTSLEAVLRARPGFIDRVVVLAEAPSTQDSARRLCAGKPGLLVLAGRQTAGRGRLGRSWADTTHLGLAATFVLLDDLPAGVVSLAAGVAAAEACESCLGRPGSLGLRWPNDVVDRTTGRKLAGVLIESSAALLFVGIGINVGQSEAEFPTELRAKATSLALLGATASRLDAARALMSAFDAALRLEAHELAARFCSRDVLCGRTASFTHNGTTHTGVVESIDPLGALVLRGPEGRNRSLPALSTSLIHDSVR